MHTVKTTTTQKQEQENRRNSTFLRCGNDELSRLNKKIDSRSKKNGVYNSGVVVVVDSCIYCGRESSCNNCNGGDGGGDRGISSGRIGIGARNSASIKTGRIVDDGDHLINKRFSSSQTRNQFKFGTIGQNLCELSTRLTGGGGRRNNNAASRGSPVEVSAGAR